MTIGSMGSEKKTVMTLEEEEKCRADVQSIDQGLTTIEEYMTQRSGNLSTPNSAHELDLPTTLARLSSRVQSITSQLPPAMPKINKRWKAMTEDEKEIARLQCEEKILLIHKEVIMLNKMSLWEDPTQDMDSCDQEVVSTPPLSQDSGEHAYWPDDIDSCELGVVSTLPANPPRQKDKSQPNRPPFENMDACGPPGAVSLLLPAAEETRELVEKGRWQEDADDAIELGSPATLNKTEPTNNAKPKTHSYRSRNKPEEMNNCLEHYYKKKSQQHTTHRSKPSGSSAARYHMPLSNLEEWSKSEEWSVQSVEWSKSAMDEPGEPENISGNPEKPGEADDPVSSSSCSGSQEVSTEREPRLRAHTMERLTVLDELHHTVPNLPPTSQYVPTLCDNTYPKVDEQMRTGTGCLGLLSAPNIGPPRGQFFSSLPQSNSSGLRPQPCPMPKLNSSWHPSPPHSRPLSGSRSCGPRAYDPSSQPHNPHTTPPHIHIPTATHTSPSTGPGTQPSSKAPLGQSAHASKAQSSSTPQFFRHVISPAHHDGEQSPLPLGGGNKNMSSSSSTSSHIRRNMFSTSGRPHTCGGNTGTSTSAPFRRALTTDSPTSSSVYLPPFRRLRTDSTTSMSSYCEPIHEIRGTSHHPNLVGRMSPNNTNAGTTVGIMSQSTNAGTTVGRMSQSTNAGTTSSLQWEGRGLSSSGSLSQFHQFQHTTYSPQTTPDNNSQMMIFDYPKAKTWSSSHATTTGGLPHNKSTEDDDIPGSASTIVDSGHKRLSAGSKIPQSNTGAAAATTNTDTGAVAAAGAHPHTAHSNIDARECHFGKQRTSVGSSSMASGSTNGIMLYKNGDDDTKNCASVSTHSTSHQQEQELEQQATANMQRSSSHAQGIDKGFDDEAFSKRARDNPTCCDGDQTSPPSHVREQHHECTKRKSPTKVPIRPPPDAPRGPPHTIGKVCRVLRASTESLAKGEERSNHAAYSSPQFPDLTPTTGTGERTKEGPQNYRSASRGLRESISLEEPMPREAASRSARGMKNGKRKTTTTTTAATTSTNGRPPSLSAASMFSPPGKQGPKTSRHPRPSNWNLPATRRTISSDGFPRGASKTQDGGEGDAWTRNSDMSASYFHRMSMESLSAPRTGGTPTAKSGTLSHTHGKFNIKPSRMTKSDTKFSPHERRGSNEGAISINEDRDGGHCINSNSNSIAGKGGACYSQQSRKTTNSTSPITATAVLQQKGVNNNGSNQRNGGGPASGKNTGKSSHRNSRYSLSNAERGMEKGEPYGRTRSISTLDHARGPRSARAPLGRAQSAHSTSGRDGGGGLYDQNVKPNVNNTNTCATTTTTATTTATPRSPGGFPTTTTANAKRKVPTLNMMSPMKRGM